MRNENIGWECPKCGICYAPTVQKCSNCIPKLDTNTLPTASPLGSIHYGSPFVLYPNGSTQQYGTASFSGTTSSNNTVSVECLNFVEVKGNKYCGNCNRPRANHAPSTYR
jgi:hypothetical protein